MLFMVIRAREVFNTAKVWCPRSVEIMYKMISDAPNTADAVKFNAPLFTAADATSVVMPMMLSRMPKLCTTLLVATSARLGPAVGVH